MINLRTFDFVGRKSDLKMDLHQFIVPIPCIIEYITLTDQHILGFGSECSTSESLFLTGARVFRISLL